MRKLLTILFVLISFVGISQPVTNRSSNVVTVRDERWMGGKNLFLPVYDDTTAANLDKGIDSCGALFYGKTYQGLWYRACNPKRWLQVLPSGAPTADTLAWRIGGNSVALLSGPPYLGTKEFKEIIFITDNRERMIIPPGGIVWDTTSPKRPILFDTVTKQLSWGEPYVTQGALDDTAANIRDDVAFSLDTLGTNIRNEIPEAANQLLFGCQVTSVNDTTFYVTNATYRLGGILYNSNDTLLYIPVSGDSARIDLFYVDTSSRASVRIGAEATNPVPPSYDPSIEVACSFTTVDADTIIVGGNTFQPWIQNGTDIQNTNSGNVISTNQMIASSGFNTSTSGVFSGIRQSASNSFDIVPANASVARWSRIGSGTGSTLDIADAFNPSSGSGTASSLKLRSNVVPVGITSRAYNQLLIEPQYVQNASGTGDITGIKYNPTVTSLGSSNHYAWWSTSGGIRMQGFTTVDSTYGLPVVIDANGNLAKADRWYGGSSGGSVGSTTPTNGLSATGGPGTVGLGGSLNQNTTVDGGGSQYEMYLGTSGDRLGVFEVNANNFNIPNGSVNIGTISEYNDPITYLPLAIDPSGNVVRMSSWYAGSGYATQSALEDTAAALRNYTTENIKYVNAGDGVVMTVTGDTATFSLPYKEWAAICRVDGSGDISVEHLLHNDFDSTLIFVSGATGSYVIQTPSASSIFDNTKLVIVCNAWTNDSNVKFYNLIYNHVTSDDNELLVYTYELGAGIAAAAESSFSITIRQYY